VIVELLRDEAVVVGKALVVVRFPEDVVVVGRYRLELLLLASILEKDDDVLVVKLLPDVVG
jgi:hypothetical protein